METRSKACLNRCEVYYVTVAPQCKGSMPLRQWLSGCVTDLRPRPSHTPARARVVFRAHQGVIFSLSNFRIKTRSGTTRYVIESDSKSPLGSCTDDMSHFHAPRLPSGLCVVLSAKVGGPFAPSGGRTRQTRVHPIQGPSIRSTPTQEVSFLAPDPFFHTCPRKTTTADETTCSTCLESCRRVSS